MQDYLSKGKVTVTTVLAAVMLTLFTGCLKQKILVKVKPDGSGNIIVSTIINKNVAASIRKQFDEQRKKMLAQGMDEATVKKAFKDPFFNEEHLKKMASQFGENITFVKAKKIKNKQGIGSIAVYAFKNIEDVRLDLKKLSSPMPQMPGSSPTDNAISFKFQKKGKIAKLKVKIPKSTNSSSLKDDNKPFKPTLLTDKEKSQMMMQGNMFGLTGKETTKEEVFRKIFNNMSINISLAVKGKLLKSNASLKNSKHKKRCTLLDIDYTTLLESDKICSKLAKNKSGDSFFETIITSKKTVKGVTIENKPELTLEFESK